MQPRRLKPRLILLHLRRGLKPRPFKTESPFEFFSSLLGLRLSAQLNPAATSLAGLAQAPNCLSRTEGRQKFLRRFLKYGMERFGSDFHERFQYEATLVHCRMGDLEAGFVQDGIRKNENVDIDVARAFVAEPQASHRGFNGQYGCQQRARRLAGLNGHYAIQKPGLV